MWWPVKSEKLAELQRLYEANGIASTKLLELFQKMESLGSHINSYRRESLILPREAGNAAACLSLGSLYYQTFGFPNDPAGAWATMEAAIQEQIDLMKQLEKTLKELAATAVAQTAPNPNDV